MQIFVQLLGGRTRTLCLDDSEVQVSSLKQKISEYEGIPCYEQRLLCAQRELPDEAVLSGDDLYFLSLSLRVVGGKGGFGSLLRGAPSKIGQKKTDNFDACRDLSGRRLRHANNEKKIQDWIASEKERDLEKVALQHIKKVANQHHFDDAKYTAESDDIKGTMSSALERGIEEAKKTGLQLSLAKKRALEEEGQPTQKRRQAWADDDDLFGDEVEEPKEKKIKKSQEEHPLTPPSPPPKTTTTTTTTTTSITTTTTTSTIQNPAITAPSSSSSSTAASSEPVPVDLSKYASAAELEADIGGERLKAELQRLGLLCGGTPADRAARLFLLKTIPLEKLDKKHFQKKKK